MDIQKTTTTATEDEASEQKRLLCKIGSIVLLVGAVVGVAATIPHMSSPKGNVRSTLDDAISKTRQAADISSMSLIPSDMPSFVPSDGPSRFPSNEPTILQPTTPSSIIPPPVGEPCREYEDCSDIPGQFCGTDFRCHWFSCKEYFQFGDITFTGHDGTRTAEELSCEPFTHNGNGPFAVSYACLRVIPIGQLGNAVAFPFNSVCSVKVQDNLLYECYDLDPSSTDFTDFEMEVATVNIPCSSDPIYGYISATSYKIRQEDGTIDRNDVQYTLATSQFRSDLALNATMFSTLVSVR